MRFSNGWSYWLVPVILCLTACGSSLPRPDPALTASASASETGGYLIGPGDTLDIFVWGQPDLSVTVPVRPDGRVSTPLIDDLVAVGKTPTQLAEEMQVVLSEYIRSPEVNVIVQGFIGTSKRMEYTVIGDTVNVASRYCDGAPGGEVLVSDAVLKRAWRRVVSVEMSIPTKHEGDFKAFRITGIRSAPLQGEEES